MQQRTITLPLGIATFLLLLLATTRDASTQIPPGNVKTWRTISASDDALAPYLEPGDEFGRSVACIGDLDGNGVLDFAVGAPGDDDDGSDAGAIYFLFMNADGSISAVDKFVDGMGGIDLGLGSGAHFGLAMTFLDPDGLPALVVGAPGQDRIAWLRLQDPSVTGFVIVASDVEQVGASLPGGSGCTLPGEAGGALAWVPNPTTGPVNGIVLAGTIDDGLAAEPTVVSLLIDPSGLTIDAASCKSPPHAQAWGVALADLSWDLSWVSPNKIAVTDYTGDFDKVLRSYTVGASSHQLDFNASKQWKGAGALSASELPGAAATYLGRIEAGFGFAPYLALGVPQMDVSTTDDGAVLLLKILADASFQNETLAWGNGMGGLPAGSIPAGARFGHALARVPDFNGDGGTDLAVGAPGTMSETGALWLLLLQPADDVVVGDFTSSLAGRPGRGSVPTSVSSGTEDVFDDLLLVSPFLDGSTVQVSKLTSKPSGDVVFVSEPGGTYIVGSEPQQALLEEVDPTAAPPVPDILAITRSGGTLDAGTLTYLPGNGDGTFDDSPSAVKTVEMASVLNSAPVVFGATTMDADLAPDTVVGGTDGVTVLLGDGLGAFSGVRGGAPLTVDVDFGEPVSVTDLALGDLDGDGDVDALAALGRQGSIGNEGGFLVPLENLDANPGALVVGTPFPALPNPNQKAVASVLLGDLDGDGSGPSNPDLDALVVLHELDQGPGVPAQATIELWLNDGAGNLTFTKSAAWAGQSFPDPDHVHPTYGALGDIDGDGDIDAVYLSSDSLAYDSSLFAGEYPPLEITRLVNQGGLQGGTEGVFVASTVGTNFSGKGLAPILADVWPFVPPGLLGDGSPDLILVWYQDVLAGTGESVSEYKSFTDVFKNDGTGNFADATPGGDTGNGPGGADVGNGGPAPNLGGLLALGGRALDPDALDVLVPNVEDNSLTLLFGVGDGTLVPGTTTIDVDPTSHGAGLVGGPLLARFAKLDGDAFRDVVVYAQYDDPTGVSSVVEATLVTLLGDGDGHFTPAGALPLAHGGDVAVGDVTGDGLDDVVITLRLGSGAPQTVVTYASVGDGTLSAPLSVVTAPAGHILTGGLALAPIDADGIPDRVTSSRDASGHGFALVLKSTAPGSVTSIAVLDEGLAPISWTQITGLLVVDVTDDAIPDVLIGERDARLFALEGLGAGTFAQLVLLPRAAQAGGGPLAALDLSGDGRADIVSTSDTEDGSATVPNLDQAFVRVAFPLGEPGNLYLETIPGASSTSNRGGALPPLLADMNGDGQPDIVLVHGTSDRVSVTLNATGGWEEYGSGKPGKGGITPRLRGVGFPRLGNVVSLDVTGAVGGAPIYWFLGLLQAPGPIFHIGLLPTLIWSDTTSGLPGATGGGSASLPLLVPDDPLLLGLWDDPNFALTLQALVRDTEIGSPPPLAYWAATNGLEITFLP